MAKEPITPDTKEESSETLTRRKLLAWLTGMGVFGSVEPRSPLLRPTRGIPIRGA